MRRPVLTYANVMSSVAVVLAMSGTAVAATQISGSTIKDRTIGHKKLVLNTVTGAEVKESTLGRVPSATSATNAGKLDGIDSTGFVRGSGVKVYQAKLHGLANETNTNVPLISLPGLGSMTVTCGGSTLAWTYTDTTSAIESISLVTADTAIPTPQFYTQALTPPVSAYGAWSHDNGANESAGVYDDLSVVSQGSAHSVAHLHLTGLTDVSGAGKCDAAVVATVQ